MSADRVSSTEELSTYIQNNPGRLVVRHAAHVDAVPYLAATARVLGCGTRVLCANASSAAALRAAGVSDAQTIQDAALGLVTDPRVSKAVGRDARVLDANELDVLMEDLKVTGIKGGRLREMFKFFCKSLSEGAPEDPAWLVNAEEGKQYAILEENLEARRAMLASEVAYRALQGIEKVPDAVSPAPVVIEDFGAMGKCAQELALALAGEKPPCVVFVREGISRGGDEPYPYEKGAEELGGEGFGSIEIEAPAPSPARSVQACGRPADEFTFVARHVSGLIEGGAAPEDVLVAVPNAVWAHRIAAALGENGVAASFDLGPAKVKGDPRYPEKAGKIRLAALLKLQRDPRDLTALRTWTGAGDWLLRSDAFLELMAHARDQGISAGEALERLHGSDEGEKMQLFHKIDEQLDLLDAIRAADAADALEPALADAGIALSEPQRAAIERGGLAALAELEAAPQAEGARAGAVRIATYQRCHALVADHVVVTGLVDGFLPAPDAIDDSHTIDHKANAFAREKRLFDDLCARARETLTLTYFTEDRIENTERLPMQVSRIRVRQGARYAQVSRSQLIEG